MMLFLYTSSETKEQEIIIDVDYYALFLTRDYPLTAEF